MATLFIHNTALKVDAVIRLQVAPIQSWLKLTRIRIIWTNIWVKRPAIQLRRRPNSEIPIHKDKLSRILSDLKLHFQLTRSNHQQGFG